MQKLNSKFVPFPKKETSKKPRTLKKFGKANVLELSLARYLKTKNSVVIILKAVNIIILL